MRNINELLIALRYAVIDTLRDDGLMRFSGLCIYNVKGSLIEQAILAKYLEDNLPARKVLYTIGSHCWDPYRPAWRLKWLDKHIELTKNVV